MDAIVGALKLGATAGDGGLTEYQRHHCGYLVGIGVPPRWTGGSMGTSLAPRSDRKPSEGPIFHAHSWSTDSGRGDVFSYFIANSVMMTANGGEILTSRAQQELHVR